MFIEHQFEDENVQKKLKPPLNRIRPPIEAAEKCLKIKNSSRDSFFKKIRYLLSV